MTNFRGTENYRMTMDIFRRDTARFGPLAAFIAQVMAPTDTLNALNREAIALFVSTINDCHYCIGAHRGALLAMGGDPASIDAIEKGDHPEAAMAALLQFAGKLTRTPGAIGKADIQTLETAGWSEADIEDTIAIVGLFALMNRIHDGYGLKGDQASFDMTSRALAANGYGGMPDMLVAR